MCKRVKTTERSDILDFYRIMESIATNNTKNREAGSVTVYPSFKFGKSKDLMTRGNSFYAIWDDKQNKWLTDPMDVIRLVDTDVWNHTNKIKEKNIDQNITVLTMENDDTGIFRKYVNFIRNMPDNFHPLDNNIIFANDNITRESYASKFVPYSLEKGPITSYDRLMSVLYEPAERDKLEWAIGSILTGDSKHLQKFIVLYGESGSGKSTFLNILQKIVEGYYITFDAKSLVNNGNSFATEIFKTNPLVAIQHDGDLSKIEDNSTLNSIISHEAIVINEKHKSQYPMAINCFLFMGSNRPVKIQEAKSGLIRRLIDVLPSGRKVSSKEYDTLVKNIDFEIGAIAYHCVEKYKKMGFTYYNNYRPESMLYATNPCFNFIEEYLIVLDNMDGVQLKQSYDMYKQFCQETGNPYIMNRQTFREEMKSYFKEFADCYTAIDGTRKRSVFIGLKKELFNSSFIPIVDDKKENDNTPEWLIMRDDIESRVDKEFGDCPAQLTNSKGTPINVWTNCKTTLKDIDTREVHYVKCPGNHIVLDFDIKNEKGEKDASLNLKEASSYPPTYAEFSKSGGGIHLHYNYTGDVHDLSLIIKEGVEVKRFVGNATLRRKLTKCNDAEISQISGGLPLVERKKDMVDAKVVSDEKHLRTMIAKCLRKEFHGSTKPECDFIYKLLDDAHKADIVYDVCDLRPAIFQFAAQSSNNSEYCISLINKMQFASEKDKYTDSTTMRTTQECPIVFYDVEVFPNLFLICYKEKGPDKKVIYLFNPTPEQVGELFKYRLIGFNNKRYDDHILYGRYIGYTNEQIYNLSMKIITKENSIRNGFREAYNIAYTDVYDFCSEKKSLKKWEIELGISHQEFEASFNEPLPEDKWKEAAKYCANDVVATEAVFDNRQADFIAREILAEMAGGSVNNTTNQLTTKLVFGDVKKPELVYTNLEETFPGYEFVRGNDGKMHNMYRGTDVGMGGYVYSEPGMYFNVALVDVQSMHPSSIIAMNYFGEFTKKYAALKDARVAIKLGDFTRARELIGDSIADRYLTDKSKADGLATALKIALNSVYGLTCASFENAMKDKINVNNIVALRGALFMRTLQDEIQARGFTVAHIKTDSIKIPNATPEIIQFCLDFAKKYDYVFEHEATYEKMCLVNNAVYIAKYAWAEKTKKIGTWTAVGAQFAEPYLFKKLFSNEDVVFDDYKQTKAVTNPASIYLDFNESLPEEEHNYIHVGKVGSFVPVVSGADGGLLLRRKDNSYSAVVGSKGYRWKESSIVKNLNAEDIIDISYFRKIVDEAIETISKYGDIYDFLEDYDDPDAPSEPDDGILIGMDDCPQLKTIAKATFERSH